MAPHTAWLLACLSITISSCDRDEEAPDKLSLLNTSTWVGSIETQTIEYDAENNIRNQTTEMAPEGQYRLMTLNNDGTAVVKYQCDKKTNCTGDVYQAKWNFTDNTLHVTLNREQFNSLADWPFLEAGIFRISPEELILEKTIYVGTAPNTVKNLIRHKYIRSQ